MNATKTVAIIAATLITAAGMTGIANYHNAAADAARAASNAAAASAIPTLPTITVRPTAAQLRQLHDAGTRTMGTSTQDLRMPYYSFANDTAGA